MFCLLDLEIIYFMHYYKLREEKNKLYSGNECDSHTVYKFKNYKEFKNYFINNGCSIDDDELFSKCILKTTKKGVIIAFKGLCDSIITLSMQNDYVKENNISKVLKKDNIQNIYQF